ncbi:hypothetical protein G6F50_014306 [Rhizopus delemar]|uniref:Uncharacterized protein n=1 Tax=Rhizopus delemar TaxID=936053 RepID=A0A9P7C8N1_9FUNG|nr:hypothetical protein G6F50_014306 [Rhizopus delemar]
MLEAQTTETFDAERSWSFAAGQEGWTAFNASNVLVSWIAQSPYYVRAEPIVGTAIGRLDRILKPAERYDPKVNPVVRVRVRFPNGCPSGMFQIYVAVNGSTSTGTNAQLRMVSKTLTGWQTVDFDLMAINEIVSGATDISRIILGDTRTASNGVFEVDFVGVGRYGAPVSRAVFLEEKSARVSADQANVESVETLQTRVKDVEGSPRPGQ